MSTELRAPDLKKDAQMFRAVPVCRGCALKSELPHHALHSAPGVYTCQVAKCENDVAYLWIC